MKILGKLLTGNGGVIGKVTDIAEKSITDKDQRNAFLAQIAVVLAQSGIAKYIRGAIGLITVVSCLFFADKMTITPSAQEKLLYAVYGFYFLDFVQSMIKNKG